MRGVMIKRKNSFDSIYLLRVVHNSPTVIVRNEVERNDEVPHLCP